MCGGRAFISRCVKWNLWEYEHICLWIIEQIFWNKTAFPLSNTVCQARWLLGLWKWMGGSTALAPQQSFKRPELSWTVAVWIGLKVEFWLREAMSSQIVTFVFMTLNHLVEYILREACAAQHSVIGCCCDPTSEFYCRFDRQCPDSIPHTSTNYRPVALASVVRG